MACTLVLLNDDAELLKFAIDAHIVTYEKMLKKQPVNEAFYRSRIKRLNNILARLPIIGA